MVWRDRRIREEEVWFRKLLGIGLIDASWLRASKRETNCATAIVVRWGFYVDSGWYLDF